VLGRSRLAFLCVSMLVLASCGSKTRKSAVLPASSEEQADFGLEELRKNLESTVLENYDQLNNGNVEALMDGVAIDRKLQIVGVTPSDIIVGKSPAALGEDRRLYRERDVQILSKNLDVHLSRDGSVGWVYDEISLRVGFEGREASIPIRSTAVYVRDVDRWVLAAEHLSYGFPVTDVFRLAAQGKLAKVPRLKIDYGGPRERAAPLIGLAGVFVNRGDLGTPATNRSDTLVLLPGPELEFHNAIAPALSTLFGPGTTVAVREFRIEVAETKRVAWMLASLTIQAKFNGDPTSIPLRASFVFERGKEDGWGIVQAHLSVGLEQEQLSAHVFGTP